MSRWPLAHLFLFMVLYLFAVTFRWLVINQPYNKMLNVLGCLGVLFRLLTVIIIEEPGGQLRFSFQLFTFSKRLVVLAAGGWYSCFILWGDGEGLNVTDCRLHLFCRLHFFFFSSPVCLPSLLSPRPLLQQCGLQWHRVFVRGAEWCELRGDGSARALSVCYVRSQAFRPQNPLVRLWLLTGVLLRRTREPSLQFWQHHCSPCDVKSLWCLWKLPTALSKERYFLLSVCFLFCVMWHWGLGWEH